MSQVLLSINNYYYRRGGAEVVFLEHNRLFEDIGWKVPVFSMRHSKNLDSPWSDYFTEEIELGGAASIGQRLRQAGKIIYSFEARRKISRMIERYRPDVAHAHNVYHHLSPSFLGVLKRSNIPTVLTLHDLKLVCPAYRMLDKDEKMCQRCKGGKIYNVLVHRCLKGSLALSGLIFMETAVHRLLGCYSRTVDRFVVPSRFYIDKFVEWGWPRHRFAYIPNFVDIVSHRPSADIGKTFVFFGRLDSQKGLSTLVRAAAEADVPLRLIGTGPDEEKLRRLAEELGHPVEFLGFRVGEELRTLIRDSRAVVLPSEGYENAPMCILEAYALGKPVLGSRIAGIPELIKEGETGFTFTTGDCDDLARLLRRVAEMRDSDLADMGRSARNWVEAEFTDVRYRERMLDLYRELGVPC